MIISIDMLDKSGIEYDWRTLYVGINANLVECSELTAYALKMMGDDKYEDDEFINEIAWGIEDNLKGEILTKMLLKFNFDMLISESKSWELELEKLRYTILNYLRNTIKDDNELLRKIEEVYADFNYPQDMEEFISYMPVKNDYNLSANSIEYNNKRMINNLDNFLAVEKKKVDAKNKL
ncbi:DUF2247 family protein [Clostridium estertheticum]|uniref:DUF2247 family protein n=1 Tax=Clostridium estertheticum TaxID=238834 RepID=A0A5N7J0R1_9CLOT|nr:DUF2247 family protein [Clostridium estertheticum]MPQ31658.1 DUF2247 family protein [Clostridium estertheticum]MPQ62324.1 DUF2247 family protein [Clostridium estertheticum]